MDVRDYIAASAAGFSQALPDWLSIPSVSADPARHDDIYGHHDVQPAALDDGRDYRGLDADRIHAPNEYVDLSRLLRGAESIAYLREELADTEVSA